MTDSTPQPRTPDLETVIKTGMEAVERRLRVALPGKVEEYNAETQTASVQPLVKETFIDADGASVTESLPQLVTVPVVFPRCGNFMITLPLVAGDHVLLVFNDRSIDKFQTGDGSEVDPLDLRNHDLSDAVAIPGFFPDVQALADASPTNMVVGQSGANQVRIKPDGNVSILQDGAGKVHVGADTAPLAIARVTDKTISDATMTTWINNVNATILQLIAFIAPPGGPGGIPLVSFPAERSRSR